MGLSKLSIYILDWVLSKRSSLKILYFYINTIVGMSGGWKKVAINNRDLYAHPARFPSLAKTNLPTIVLI